MENIKIKRSNIIKYIFDWAYDKDIEGFLKEIKNKFPIITIFKGFYNKFASIMTNLEREKLIKLIEKGHENTTINRFLTNLKKDYKAVLNAATYKMNNGITEGNVNKIKVIKRDMYGRASIELLRNKIVYQSLFYYT